MTNTKTWLPRLEIEKLMALEYTIVTQMKKKNV